MRIADQLGPVLPQLRRYARALAGSQASGDTYVRVMLESLIAEPQQWDESTTPRLAAFRLFHRVWDAIGQDDPGDIPSAAPDASGEMRVADRRLAALGPRNRQAFLLSAMEGFSVDDVAKILDTSVENAKELIHAADREIQDMTKSRVLIIEDEPIIALDIQGLVEELGHTVIDVCATRITAVASARSNPPDIVLADIHLADGSSGLDAAADILERLSIPIVVITAYPERLLTGRRVEPAFLITKPFQPEAVRAAISQALFFDRSTPKPN